MNEMVLDFVHDGEDALSNFEVVRIRHDHDTLPGMIEAQADTGSRYVVYTTPMGYPESVDMVVTVRWPWQAVCEITPQSYVTPEYLTERLGAEHRGPVMIGHYHGGDVFALLECLRRLIGITYPSPQEWGGLR